MPGKDGRQGDATYLRTKRRIFVSGRTQALRYFNHFVDGVTERLATFRYKVRGICRQATGNVSQPGRLRVSAHYTDSPLITRKDSNRHA